MPAMHHRYDPQAFPAPPGGEDPGPAAELDELRVTLRRLRLRFAVANGAGFTLTVLLATTAGGLLGTEVFGRVNVGMLLGAAQGMLLLATAWYYDRRCTRYGDPLADALREEALRAQAGEQQRGRGAGRAPWTDRGAVGR